MRGQITVFMILGIVILSAFALLFLLSSKLSDIHLRTQQSKIDTLDLTAFNAEVTTCLRRSSEEGIILIGEQGGELYASQVANGQYFRRPDLGMPDFTGIGHINLTEGARVMNISYAIHRRDSDGDDGVLFEPPAYPYGGQLVSGKGLPFGSDNPTKTIPNLCQPFGANAKNLSIILGINEQLINNSCKERYLFTTDQNRSIQRYLQDYIANQTTLCVNLSNFDDLYGLDFQAGKLNATLLFGENDVVIVALWPLTASRSGEEPVTRLESFRTTIPVRLKKAYLSVARLVFEDMQDPFFDPILNQSSLCAMMPWGSYPDNTPVHCVDEGMVVTRLVSPVNYSDPLKMRYNSTDIVRLNDTRSIVGGKPFVFQYAVENRIPALDLVKNTPEGSVFDIITTEGEDLTINPFAFDPDWDFHDGEFMVRNYTYQNWQEDNWTIFDESRCKPVGPIDCRIHLDQAIVPCNDNSYPQICKDYSGINSFAPPRKFSSSALYMATKRNTSIHIARTDLGNHTLNISICDDAGACDWQDISVLVMDQPISIITPPNIFPDTDHFAISTEDMFSLNASASIVYYSPLGSPTFRWHDQASGAPGAGNVLYDATAPQYFGSLATVLYPVPLPGEVINISNITIAPVMHRFASIGTKTVNLTVMTPDGRLASTVALFDVTRCLPTGVASNPYSSSLPYPYFEGDNGNPFMTRHVCCQPSGSFQPSSTSCYNIQYYTALPYADPSKLPSGANLISPMNRTVKEQIPMVLTRIADLPVDNSRIRILDPAGNSIDLSDPANKIYRNDIFQRTASQSCSGDRGNACSGAYTDIWQVVKECDDAPHNSCKMPCTFGDTHCDPLNLASLNLGSTPPDCVDAPAGRTFESVFGLDPSDLCDDTPRCISGNKQCAGKLCGGNGNCNVDAQCSCVQGQCGACTIGACGTVTDFCLKDLPGFPRDQWRDFGGNAIWDTVQRNCDTATTCQCSDPAYRDWNIDSNNPGSIDACQNCFGATYKTPSSNLFFVSGTPNCCGDDPNEAVVDASDVVDPTFKICCANAGQTGYYNSGAPYCT